MIKVHYTNVWKHCNKPHCTIFSNFFERITSASNGGEPNSPPRKGGHSGLGELTEKEVFFLFLEHNELMSN
jgi:hypothetical protein